ncbi:hypothetical protein M5K25_026206 [Dendrobium thyrsiflorum]|uniref:Uncharacterized protein n=1 Tax=Dendrobium thyrsiflorum TaxID=117978 RepID=A0ABD0TWU6_DENTH
MVTRESDSNRGPTDAAAAFNVNREDRVKSKMVVVGRANSGAGLAVAVLADCGRMTAAVGWWLAAAVGGGVAMVAYSRDGWRVYGSKAFATGSVKIYDQEGNSIGNYYCKLQPGALKNGKETMMLLLQSNQLLQKIRSTQLKGCMQVKKHAHAWHGHGHGDYGYVIHVTRDLVSYKELGDFEVQHILYRKIEGIACTKALNGHAKGQSCKRLVGWWWKHVAECKPIDLMQMRRTQEIMGARGTKQKLSKRTHPLGPVARSLVQTQALAWLLSVSPLHTQEKAIVCFKLQGHTIPHGSAPDTSAEFFGRTPLSSYSVARMPEGFTRHSSFLIEHKDHGVLTRLLQTRRTRCSSLSIERKNRRMKHSPSSRLNVPRNEQVGNPLPFLSEGKIYVDPNFKNIALYGISTSLPSPLMTISVLSGLLIYGWLQILISTWSGNIRKKRAESNCLINKEASLQGRNKENETRVNSYGYLVEGNLRLEVDIISRGGCQTFHAFSLSYSFFPSFHLLLRTKKEMAASGSEGKSEAGVPSLRWKKAPEPEGRPIAGEGRICRSQMDDG